jgi:hypothetical protein
MGKPWDFFENLVETPKSPKKNCLEINFNLNLELDVLIEVGHVKIGIVG